MAGTDITLLWDCRGKINTEHLKFFAIISKFTRFGRLAVGVVLILRPWAIVIVTEKGKKQLTNKIKQ